MAKTVPIRKLTFGDFMTCGTDGLEICADFLHDQIKRSLPGILKQLDPDVPCKISWRIETGGPFG